MEHAENREFTALTLVSVTGAMLYLAGRQDLAFVLLAILSMIVFVRFVLILSKRRFTVDLLMGIVGLVTLWHGALLEGLLVLALYGFAETIEELVEDYARRKVESLRELIPEYARVVEDGKIVEKPVRDIRPGDIVVVRVGETVPVDGESLDEGQLDLSHITGEPHPAPVRPGNTVPSGATVVEGPIRVRALRESRESTVQKLVESALEALEEKPRIARLLERYSPHITLAVLAAYAGVHELVDPVRALSILLVGCPSAFIITSSYSTSLAIAALARQGVAVLDSSVLEKLWRIDYLVLDKTGTLTTLTARLVDNIDSETLSLIVGAARMSKHPVSNAIARLGAKGRVVRVREIVGQGLVGAVEIRSGPEMECGKTAEARVNGARALFCIEESLTEGARELVDEARHLGARVMVVSGDTSKNVEKVSMAVGVESFMIGASPGAKANVVEELSSKGRVVFVGDGVNDTIALAKAHVGIVVGDLDAPRSVADAVVPEGPKGIVLLFRAARLHRRALLVGFITIIIVKFIALIGGLLGIPLPLVALLGDDGSTLAGITTVSLILKKIL